MRDGVGCGLLGADEPIGARRNYEARFVSGRPYDRYMVRLADQCERFPLLSHWIAGAKLSHPWAYEIHDEFDTKYGYDTFAGYEPVEAVLRTMRAAKPNRIEGKRRDFRSVRSGPGMQAIETELTFAARLAAHGIAFDFGAPSTPQPDLVLCDLGLGIEITHRKADPTWDLKWHLKNVFQSRASSTQLHIELEFSAMPFAIRSKVRDALVDEIRRAAMEGESTVHCVVRPARGGQPAITVKATIYPTKHAYGFPKIKFSEDVDRYRVLMADVEDAIVQTMRDKRKRRQAAAMPTALMIDLNRVKGAHLRPSNAWVDRLLGLIEPEDKFVGVGLLYGRHWDPESPLILVRNPHVDAGELSGLRTLCRALDLPRRLPRAS